MRSLTAAFLALAAVLDLQGTGQAQPPPRIRIDEGGVRVGFPAGNDTSGFKTGFWAPVYVDLTAGDDRISRADGVIVVETTDNDDMPNVYTVPLPPMEPREQATAVTYVRTGTVGSEVAVTVHGSDGHVLASRRAKSGSYSAAPPGAFLYLTAGAPSYPLRRALHPAKGNDPNAAQEQDDPNHLDSFANVEHAVGLPTRWFGYASADVVILESGGSTFVKELLEDNGNRKEALAEWVRRGGRLVISVGHEHQLMKALLEKLQVIGGTVNGIVQRASLGAPAQWAGVGERLQAKPRKAAPGKAPTTEKVEVARLDVDPLQGVQVLLSEPADANDAAPRPLILQAPCGLGRVILVAFDLDRPPFTDWSGQDHFWQKLNSELRPNQVRETGQQAGVPNWGGPGMPGWDSSHNDVGTLLQDRLEAFDEVPVISFGWVALFILVYILVVGPLDYLFLKKVVKRLELTWITFPAVVLVVSAVAYLSAYYLKGKDLRINKVDVVDVVAQPPDRDAPAPEVVQGAHAYGTTWFTLFSPRIQNYTVGVEPAATTWVPDMLAERTAPPNPHSVVVSWMGRPENTWGGTGRTNSSPGLFRRVYEYAPDAAALEGVPIQVWSTKSFTATWQAALPKDRPLFRAQLQRSGRKGEDLTGTITSELPAELQDAVLFWHNQYYKLGPEPLQRGVPRSIDKLNVGEFGNNEHLVEKWFQDVQVPAYYNQYNSGYGSRPRLSDAGGLAKELMFAAEDTANGHPRNNSLRYLDQTWRLHTDEVIVVGRLPRQQAAAEQVTQDAVSPTRLWLGQVPAPGEARRPLDGKLTQETYVRIFIPVPPK